MPYTALKSKICFDLSTTVGFGNILIGLQGKNEACNFFKLAQIIGADLQPGVSTRLLGGILTNISAQTHSTEQV